MISPRRPSNLRDSRLWPCFWSNRGATGSQALPRYRTEFEKRDASLLTWWSSHARRICARARLLTSRAVEDDLPDDAGAAADPAVIASRLPFGESIEGADDPNGGGTCDISPPGRCPRPHQLTNPAPLRLWECRGKSWTASTCANWPAPCWRRRPRHPG